MNKTLNNSIQTALSSPGPDAVRPTQRNIRAVLMLQEVDKQGGVIGRRVMGASMEQYFTGREQVETTDEHHADRIEHMAGAALHDLLRQLNPSELVGVFMQAMRKDGGV